jgi:HD superfamily phosphohydrolase
VKKPEERTTLRRLKNILIFAYYSPIMSKLLAGVDHKQSEKVRCPIHGFIRYSKNERKIIDHWTFQRLRHIRQLAMTYLVYPGAMHSRFEHSLGVMELTTRVFDTVCIESEERIVEELQRIPEFKEDTIAKARQTVRLMALLHDVGHPAFSHAAESTIPGKDHELLSVYVIDQILGPDLDKINYIARDDPLLNH